MTSARSGSLLLIRSAARFTAALARAAVSEPAKSLSAAGAADGTADVALGDDTAGALEPDDGGLEPADGEFAPADGRCTEGGCTGGGVTVDAAAVLVT